MYDTSPGLLSYKNPRPEKPFEVRFRLNREIELIHSLRPQEHPEYCVLDEGVFVIFPPDNVRIAWLRF